MKTRVLIAVIALLGAASAHAAPLPAKPVGVKCGDSYIAAGKTCTKAPVKPMGKGVPCGDSFIAAGQVCHKPTAMAAKPAMAAPAKTAMMAPAKPAMAKPMAAKPMAPKPMAAAAPAAKGKKCGNSYIPATAVCTKK